MCTFMILSMQREACVFHTGSDDLRCPGRTSRQRHCNVTDCDPLVPVQTFDHNATSTHSDYVLLPSQNPRITFQFFCVVSILLK